MNCLQMSMYCMPTVILNFPRASHAVINRAFELAHKYNISLAQPSVCLHANSASGAYLVGQQKNVLLRYTTFVEMNAPILSMNMLENVALRTLDHVHTGWGLEFVWPFLLNYGRTQVAIIDEVCYFHPLLQPPKQTLYESEHPLGLCVCTHMWRPDWTGAGLQNMISQTCDSFFAL